MDVDFAGMFQGQTRIKSGPDTRHCQALVKSIDTERKRITAVASAGTVDRHDEIIEPSAFAESLPGFMKNPVVLAAHQHRLSDGRSSVVANVTSAKIDKNGLNTEIEFHCLTDLSKEYWELYSKKVQKGISVGFIPQDGRHKQSNGKSVYAHTKVELLELSCVPVGANREALTRSAQRKADFVEGKRRRREDEKILAEIEQEDPDDLKADEFAEIVLGIKALPWEAKEEGNENLFDYADMFSEEQKSDYAAMF